MNSLQATRAFVSNAKSKGFLVCNCLQTQHLGVRYKNTKHWRPGPVKDWNKGIYNYEWKRARGRKIVRVDLPNFDEKRMDHSKLTPDEIRSKLKEKGIVPIRSWSEKPLLIRSTNQLIDGYVPPEGDGKRSLLTKDGIKQGVELLKKKGGSYRSVRKIRDFFPDFDLPSFATEALDIYVKAHQALAEENEDLLHEYVTDSLYPDMVHNTEYKTIRWQFIKSLEEPRVVRVRHQEMMDATDLYAQITVRLFTQQILAVYDRFGRLMLGSEHVVKDVLEYVVFERHLTAEYAQWRLHDKILPDWAPGRPPIYKTYRVPDSPHDSESNKEKTAETKETTKPEISGEQPAFA